METTRLYLRKYRPAEKESLIALFTDEAVMKYVGDGVMTPEQAAAWWDKLFDKFYPRGLDIWAVFERTDSIYIGHAGIYPRPTRPEEQEFVYFLRREEWGNGYATEIARRLVEFGFDELGLAEVFASVDDEHTASINVLEKAGLKFKRFEYDDDGRFSVYSIEKNAAGEPPTQS
jgi:RimJ/RimL family protein N-acetyltransferase